MIMFFAANSCKPDSCDDGFECRSVNGLGKVECVEKVEITTASPVCEANPCCESGPNPELCCQNGVCSNENYVFIGDAITNNTDECKCLCTDNFSGLFKYSHHIETFNETDAPDCMCFMISFLEIKSYFQGLNVL